MRFGLNLAAFVLAGLAAACAAERDAAADKARELALKPGHDFDAAKAPPAPDYDDAGAWAALPERADTADEAPEGESEAQSDAAADVFFIHPTSWFSRDGWNAPHTEGGEGGMSVDGGAMRAQASAFNACCRVFAPRYRQATLWTFLDFTPNSEKALDLAYGDIERAFDHYMATRNEGRPFILAAHSQGSYHAMRLLEERILGAPAGDLMVAAYAIGGPVIDAFTREALPACTGPDETGCLIGWNAVTASAEPDLRRDERALIWFEGRYQPTAGRPFLCTNPLDWSKGGAAPASANLGALPPARGAGALPAVLPGYAGATCRENGYLIVDFPQGDDAYKSRFTENGSYHVFDYNLFYMNIRENARARVEAFIGGGG